MRVLVTGARGFIGSHLVRRLLSEKHTVIELDTKDMIGLQCIDGLGQMHCRFKGSVLDPSAVKMAYAQEPTHVVHLASIAGVPSVTAKPLQTMDVVTLGTLNMVKHAPELKAFVFLSTSEVQGIHAFQVAEDRHNVVGPPGEARWTYAVSKLYAEHYLMAAKKQDGFPGVVLRPFNVYGPEQVGFGAVHEFITAALDGGMMNVFHNGTQIRSWCYVTDMVDAIVLALDNPRAQGEIFNIGNPAATVSVYELAKKIQARLGGKIFKHPRVFQDVELRSPNIEKARDILGFDPKVELDEGLDKTVEWYRGNK